MPYKNNDELPDPIKDSLPDAAQTIWRKAFNAAEEEYSDEETASKVAWTAVKQVYKKVGEKWVRKEGKMYTVKALGETPEGWKIGGYGMIWGSPQQRDLSPWQNIDGTRGEFFTPDTKGLDDIPVKVITFQHDMDLDPEGVPFQHALGYTTLERNDKEGRWVEAMISKRAKWAERVMELVGKGALSFSSDTARHWLETGRDGQIKRWRTTGYTLTPHPMEPRITGVMEIKALYESAGLELPSIDEDKAGAGAPGPDSGVRAKARAISILARLNTLED